MYNYMHLEDDLYENCCIISPVVGLKAHTMPQLHQRFANTAHQASQERGNTEKIFNALQNNGQRK